VPLAVLPLVLLAAVFHAAWNALLKASENPLSLATRALTWGTIVSLPPVAVAWVSHRPPRAPIGRLAARARLGIPGADLLHRAVHRVSARRALCRLSNRPRHGATACGSGRLLLLGERLHALAIVGVIALLGGIWAVRRPAPRAPRCGPRY